MEQSKKGVSWYIANGLSLLISILFLLFIFKQKTPYDFSISNLFYFGFNLLMSPLIYFIILISLLGISKGIKTMSNQKPKEIFKDFIGILLFLIFIMGAPILLTGIYFLGKLTNETQDILAIVVGYAVLIFIGYQIFRLIKFIYNNYTNGTFHDAARKNEEKIYVKHLKNQFSKLGIKDSYLSDQNYYNEQQINTLEKIILESTEGDKILIELREKSKTEYKNKLRMDRIQGISVLVITICAIILSQFFDKSILKFKAWEWLVSVSLVILILISMNSFSNAGNKVP
jgi:hypothetical protein